MAIENSSSNHKVNDVWKAYDEAKNSMSELYQQMRQDFEFYMSKQWTDSDIEAAMAKQAPALTLNYIKKMADTISGFERQAPSDIKCFPIEGGDMRTSEVYSRLIKWIMTDRGMNSEVSRAFKDAIVCGVGWLAPSIKFDLDIINGDIDVRKVDPFNILVDPHFKQPDLSDADYIIKHTRMSKDKLARLFPDKKGKIMTLSNTHAHDNDGIREETIPPSDQGNRILVVEYWYREIVAKTILINQNSPIDQKRFEGTKEELETLLSQDPNLRAIKRKVNEIRYRVVAEKILLFDGDNPYETEGYPIIPIWGYFDTSNKWWKYRVSGIIRHLKDPQREKNKRRSVLMQILNKMPNYGWIMDQNAADPDALKRGDNIIEVTPGRTLTPMPTPDLPQAAMALETLFDQDMLRIGTNLDTLGIPQDRGEPGVVISQRIRQGLMSHQELFDNLANAKKMLGRQLVKLIGNNYSREKIHRILGQDIKIVPEGMEQQVKQAAEQAAMIEQQVAEEKQKLNNDLDRLDAQGAELDPQVQQQIIQQMDQMDAQVQQARQQAQAIQTEFALKKAEEQTFWNHFDNTRETARYDCTIDETSNNVTFRVGTLEQLMRLIQFNMPVPMESIVELLDIPIEQKKAMLERIQQQQQLAAQAAQQEQQKDANEVQLEIRKQDMGLKQALIQQGLNPDTGEPLPEQSSKSASVSVNKNV
jgi:hypothetical protein